MQPVTTFVPQGMRVSTLCRYRRECDRLGNGCLSARRCNTTTWVALSVILLLRVTLSLRAILLVDTVTVLPVIEIWIGSAFGDPRIHALCSLNRYGLPAWIGIGLAFGAVGWMHKWCSLERRLPAGFEKFLVGSTVG